LDQTTPAWRVFDEPAAGQAPAAAGGGAGGRNPEGGAAGVALTTSQLLLAAAAVVGAVLIGGIAVAVALGSSDAAIVEGPVATSGAILSGSAAPAGEPLVVDVAGAVVKPGLYRLPDGARVGDAIDAAGGFGPRVDVDRVGRELNLAAAVSDGDQVRVPSRDDPSVAPGGGGGASAGSGGGASGGTSGVDGAGGLIDLNTATQGELEALPGIGPVTAGKIIAARSETPFRSVDELRERGLVGEKTFEEIRPLVTAG
jgi:competence protein ComEA